jgi:hypothetical protein
VGEEGVAGEAGGDHVGVDVAAVRAGVGRAGGGGGGGRPRMGRGWGRAHTREVCHGQGRTRRRPTIGEDADAGEVEAVAGVSVQGAAAAMVVWWRGKGASAAGSGGCAGGWVGVLAAGRVEKKEKEKLALYHIENPNPSIGWGCVLIDLVLGLAHYRGARV